MDKWIVFENCDANDESHNIYNYNFSACFDTEQEAIAHEMQNPDYRVRRYVKIPKAMALALAESKSA